MKFFAAFALATTKAIGVARPKAQGQEIKSTAQECKKLYLNLLLAPKKQKLKKQKYYTPYKVFRNLIC